MSEPNRPVTPTCILIDIEADSPFPGQLVLALTEGGKLVETRWNERHRDHFFAWAPYPKVPPAVKEKLFTRYSGGYNGK